MARKSRQMPLKTRKGEEKGERSGNPLKIYCRASLRRDKGLISPIRVYILIVCFFWFLFDAIEKIIVQFWEGFE